METFKCPYCETKVRVYDVDADDGSCPECGAPLMGSSVFSPDDMNPGYDDDFDEDDDVDDYDYDED